MSAEKKQQVLAKVDDDAVKICKLLYKTHISHRGRLLRIAGEELKRRSQGYTGQLLIDELRKDG